MVKDQKDIELVIRRAEETLQTARHGYEDLIGTNKNRRFSGLRNLIVFGRSVTWVLQNLRSVNKNDFEDWYVPEQEKMKNDPLMRYFINARNEIEKQGRINVSTRAKIHFSSGDIEKFGPPPPGAKGIFIADQFGGTGWEVEMPNGTKEKYYVELPAEIGEVKQQFINFPETADPELKGKSVEELCELYLNRLEMLLDSAREQFLEQPTQKIKGKRLPPYLRVIK
jgi:hypothetical protein